MVDLKNGGRLNCLWIPVAMTLILAGCAGMFDRKPQLSDLDNPNSTIKIVAIKWAGDNKVSSALPQLVSLLQDEDRAVRLYSIEALRRITGTDCGYDYKDAAHVRADSVECWQRFLETDRPQHDRKGSQNGKD